MNGCKIKNWLRTRRAAVSALYAPCSGLNGLIRRRGRSLGAVRRHLDGKPLFRSRTMRKPRRRTVKALRFFKRKAAGRRADSPTASSFRKRKCRANRVAAQSRPYVSSSARRRDGAQTAQRQALFGSGNVVQIASPHSQGLTFLQAQGGGTARRQPNGKLFSEAEMSCKSRRRTVKALRFFKRKAAGRRRLLNNRAHERRRTVRTRRGNLCQRFALFMSSKRARTSSLRPQHFLPSGHAPRRQPGPALPNSAGAAS